MSKCRAYPNCAEFMGKWVIGDDGNIDNAEYCWKTPICINPAWIAMEERNKIKITVDDNLHTVYKKAK